MMAVRVEEVEAKKGFSYRTEEGVAIRGLISKGNILAAETQTGEVRNRG